MKSGLSTNAAPPPLKAAYSPRLVRGFSFRQRDPELEFFYTVLLMVSLASIIWPAFNLQVIVCALLLCAIRKNNRPWDLF